LAIDPWPRHRTERRDAHDIREVRFEIDSPHRELVVTSRSSVEVCPAPEPEGTDLPWETVANLLAFDARAPWQPAALEVCNSPLAFAHPDLRALVLEVFRPGRPLREAAVAWMGLVHREIRFVPQATDVTTNAIEALRLGQGVCQDLAHVMIAGLRSIGLAARYISGYLLTLPPPGQPRLIGADASHAWVSVWCPTAQWFELDPTNHRAPGDDYVTLARGRDYRDIAPIRGVIRGGGSHTVAVSVTVQDLPTGP
jgi:transglutaminase-like putative cysteine protease